MNIVFSKSSGTHAHTNDTNEQTVVELTPTQINAVWGVWLDLTNLTQSCTIKRSFKVDGTNYRLFKTDYWSTTLDDGVLLTPLTPINDDFKVTLTSAALEGASRNVPYVVIYAGLGAAASSWVYTVTDSATSLAIADVEVWVTTDSNGTNIVASGTTNTAGEVTFYLDSGTYYVWRKKDGWNFSDPDTEVI